MLAKPRMFGDLVTQVIRNDLCTFCGACMASCPLNVLWPVGEQPTVKGSCGLCEICYHQCPVVEFPKEEIEASLHGRRREANEPLGIFRDALVGKSWHSEIQSRGQDGGVVTSLLAYALDNRLIDAAVVAGRDADWRPKPIVATSYEELVKAAGTKYTPSPTLMGVRSALEEFGKVRVGLVGTPCQIRAVRRTQRPPFGHRGLGQAVAFTIGLFCMESYAYDALIGKYLAEKMIDPSAVTRVAIKKGCFIASSGTSELLRVPLKEIDQYVRGSCRVCDDFTAEYADVSVGGIGCPNGHSTILTRTELGDSLVKNAEKKRYLTSRPLVQGEKGFEKIVRMAQEKRLRLRVQS